jgi:hypothetical protein
MLDVGLVYYYYSTRWWDQGMIDGRELEIDAESLEGYRDKLILSRVQCGCIVLSTG